MKPLLILFALLMALAAPVAAQTTISTTTLTNAITSASPQAMTIVVGSTSGMEVNGILYIDGSVYRILAVPSTTQVRVIQQNRPALHAATITVYIVPVGAQVGSNPVGVCIRSTAGTYQQGYQNYGILFNLSTGEMVTCRLNVLTSGVLNFRVTSPYNAGTPSPNPPQTQ